MMQNSKNWAAALNAIGNIGMAAVDRMNNEKQMAAQIAAAQKALQDKKDMMQFQAALDLGKETGVMGYRYQNDPSYIDADLNRDQAGKFHEDEMAYKYTQLDANQKMALDKLKADMAKANQDAALKRDENNKEAKEKKERAIEAFNTTLQSKYQYNLKQVENGDMNPGLAYTDALMGALTSSQERLADAGVLDKYKAVANFLNMDVNPKDPAELNNQIVTFTKTLKDLSNSGLYVPPQNVEDIVADKFYQPIMNLNSQGKKTGWFGPFTGILGEDNDTLLKSRKANAKTKEYIQNVIAY